MGKKSLFRYVSCFVVSMFVMSVFFTGMVSAAPVQILETIDSFDFTGYSSAATAKPSGFDVWNASEWSGNAKIKSESENGNTYVGLYSGSYKASSPMYDPTMLYSPTPNPFISSNSFNGYLYMSARIKFNNTNTERVVNARASSQDAALITFDKNSDIIITDGNTATKNLGKYTSGVWYTLDVRYNLNAGQSGPFYITLKQDGGNTITATGWSKFSYLTSGVQQIRIQQKRNADAGDTAVDAIEGIIYIDDVRFSKSVGTTEITDNQTATCTYVVKNTTTAPMDALLLVAIYKDDELYAVNLDKTASSIAASGSATLNATATLDTPTDGITAKAFVWNSTGGVFKPLTGAIPIQ